MKKWVRRIGFVVLPLVAAIAVAYTAFHIAAGARLEETLADLEAAGVSLDLAKVAPAPIPDAENGALIYREAVREARERFPEGLPGLDDQDVDRLREIVAQAQPVFARLKEAAEKEECRFDANWDVEAVVTGSMDRLSDFILLSDLTRAHVRVLSRAGPAEELGSALLAWQALADSIRLEPIILSLLVRSVLWNKWLSAFEEALRDSEIPERELRRIAEHLGTDSFWRDARRAFHGEMAYGATVRLVGFRSEVALDAWLKWDTATYLRMMRRLIDDMDHSWVEAFRACSKTLDEVEALNPYVNSLTILIVPGFRGALENVEITLTKMEFARVAIELELDRRRTGRLADRLENPPLTGGPIEYNPEKGELRSPGGRSGPIVWKLRTGR
jgi:hypothetical protein